MVFPVIPQSQISHAGPTKTGLAKGQLRSQLSDLVHQQLYPISPDGCYWKRFSLWQYYLFQFCPSQRFYQMPHQFLHSKITCCTCYFLFLHVKIVLRLAFERCFRNGTETFNETFIGHVVKCCEKKVLATLYDHRANKMRVSFSSLHQYYEQKRVAYESPSVIFHDI